jgi:hypothetical protein
LFGLVALPSFALADDDDDDDDKVKKTRWGIGATVRTWYAPEWLQETIWADTPGNNKDRGAGIEFHRRTGSLELTIGFGWDKLELTNGYYLEKGGDPMVAGEVMHNTFDGLEWFTAEVNIVNNLTVHKFLELRFGAGIGAGYLRGDVLQTEAVCTTERIPEDCSRVPGAERDVPAEIPPAMPVINVFVGLQVTPFDWLHLRVDAGVHTAPFVAAGAALYAW